MHILPLFYYLSSILHSIPRDNVEKGRKKDPGSLKRGHRGIVAIVVIVARVIVAGIVAIVGDIVASRL